jgi:hypothetical protein
MPVFLLLDGLLFFTREEDDKKDRRDKNVHPYRIQVGHPSARDILPGEETGPDDQILDSHKKLAVKMGDILKKVPDDISDRFLRLQILLAAPRTIPLLYGKAAVQAGLVMSEMMAAHSFFLKILFFSPTPD